MITHCLGFPRIGIQRELKRKLEKYWRGECAAESLQETAAMLRLRHWQLQKDAGLSLVTVGDFSLYDHVLDTACMFNLIPERFQGESDPLQRYFNMARGNAQENIAPMEMTKWFDSNYHYTVPEWTDDLEPVLNADGLCAQLEQARAAGFETKTVLTGPITLLKLGKTLQSGYDRWQLVDKLASCYAACINRLKQQTQWIQLDEPVLALDLDASEKEAFQAIYSRVAATCDLSHVMLTTYFGPIDHNVELLCPFPFGGLHLDLVRGQAQLDALKGMLPEAVVLSLGVVDGRNIWRTEYEQALSVIEQARELGPEVWLGTSCSLLHTPIDLDGEQNLPPEVKEWMAFAKQKCREVVELEQLARGAADTGVLARNREVWSARRASAATRNAQVRSRMAAIDDSMQKRLQPVEERVKAQRECVELPLLPTTTIGSFPQTAELRSMRRKFGQGKISAEEYTEYVRDYIRNAVNLQVEIGLDVLVHGEPERNDMVEYFGQQLDGYCFSANGWVQSYGSRCVKPPIIYGDVSRPEAMTVDWISYAQSLTNQPMKGMLTGPVTMLCWSFVRNDQPRSETCRQIALAIRDEVADLEQAGIRMIQIDEAAFREGLPLRRQHWDAYLSWAVECFRLTSCVVADETQIHTHMCYSEFNDMLEWIARMDADVISIEASRSRMDILDAFQAYEYPAQVGPGVYDIHSERIPSVEEIEQLIGAALKLLPAEQLWINPDCGLKTRGWPEAVASLRNMIAATQRIRADLSA